MKTVSKRDSQGFLDEGIGGPGYSREGVISRTIRVLLMGGIGSGKSTLAGFLRQRGALTINADEVGHEVLEREAHEAVAARWPSVIEDGAVNRSALAKVVFNDSRQLRELESITHPYIAERIRRAADAAGERVVVVELPVLLNLPAAGWIRVAVTAEDDIRLARLVDRGMDEADARSRMASQPGQDRWVAEADLVVDNSGPLEGLPSVADELLSRIEELTTERVAPSP